MVNGDTTALGVAAVVPRTGPLLESREAGGLVVEGHVEGLAFGMLPGRMACRLLDAQPGPRVLVTLIALSLASLGRSQCTTQVLSGGAYPGANSAVLASAMWDSDGPGPAPSRLVVGGYFTAVGYASSRCIGAVDPATGVWTSLGSGFGHTSPNSPRVRSLAVLPNGNLVAAGSFDSAGGVAANNIAQWNGSSWSPLGGGLFDPYHAGEVYLAVLPNGELVAAGYFSLAGGIPVNNIARWNGTTWSSMGGTLTQVRDLTVAPNGDLIVSGWYGIWRWNGTWSQVQGLPGVVAGGPVAVLPNGDLCAYSSGTSLGLMRYSGGQWSQLAAFGNGAVWDLQVLSSGVLLVGGNFNSVNGLPAAGVASWNGVAWSALGSGVGGWLGNANYVYTITELPNGTAAVGGSFLTAGGLGAENLAMWTGVQWLSFGGGASDSVLVLRTLRDGSLLAGGKFQTLGGVVCNRIARRSNGVWTALGPGIAGEVRSLVELPNGDLVAGSYESAGSGQTVNVAARWNGSSWVPLGGPVTNPGGAAVNALAVMPNGDVVAGGYFSQAGGVSVVNIARWNGTAWSPLGSGFPNLVTALLVLPNGDLIASFGSFGFSGLLRWNGSYWSNVGGGLSFNSYVPTLALLPGGDMVAGGNFSSAGGVPVQNVARWNGTSWAAMGAGLPANVMHLEPLPDGDILALVDVNVGPRVWRWHGGTWTLVPALVAQPLNDDAVTAALAPNGDVWLGGQFQAVGPVVAFHLAILVPTCRATATAVPTGCVRPTGSLALQATVLPWVGGLTASSCSSFAVNGAALAVAGLSPSSLPLSVVDPSAGANCALLANPDVLELLPTVGGVARWQMGIPANPSLVGVVIYHQMVEAALGSQGLLGLYASNGLQLTIGVI